MDYINTSTMSEHPLIQYINNARANSMTMSQILRALVDAGWQVEEIIDEVLNNSIPTYNESATDDIHTIGHFRPRDIVTVANISKLYGKLKALDSVSFGIERGSITAILGPNGAGKTTLIRILTTLLVPDAGWANVAGFDVVRDAQALRSIIGLAGQYAAIDEILSGRENLEMVGRLYHLDKQGAKQRADELIKQFDLEEAGDRSAKTYSGGMRRRLDLAASLVIKPQILFLDEPTNGLDPRGRFELWHIIHDLVQEGTTVFLTTQYLEEADQLANQIFVIDHGRIIAKGTPDELKRQVGGDVLEVHIVDGNELNTASGLVARFGHEEPRINTNNNIITIPVDGGATILADIVRQFDTSGVKIRDIGLRRPSLDDVFMKLTGHQADEKY